MSAFIASGRVVDLALGLMVLEGIALFAWHSRTGGGVPPLDLLSFLLSGGFLLLGLRAALTGASWVWIALALTAAFLAHLVDLRRRWRGPPLVDDRHAGRAVVTQRERPGA